jgi:uncharacterized SAM-binding protein YcdF (DUF218 family)
MNEKLVFIMGALVVVLSLAIFIESFFHTHSDAPVDSDAIVILGGGDQGRVEEAAALYDAGYAENVIVTPVGDRFTTDELISIVRHYGINQEDIIIDDESTSTYTNAERSMALMAEHGFESALIVTSDYHVKRAALIFDRLNDGEFEFKYIASTNLEDRRWYEREDAGRHWFNEFVKIWGYRLGLYKITGGNEELPSEA